jgi:hypothetical protein
MVIHQRGDPLTKLVRTRLATAGPRQARRPATGPPQAEKIGFFSGKGRMPTRSRWSWPCRRTSAAHAAPASGLSRAGVQPQLPGSKPIVRPGDGGG